jgi:hypothetical protein
MPRPRRTIDERKQEHRDVITGSTNDTRYTTTGNMRMRRMVNKIKTDEFDLPQLQFRYEEVIRYAYFLQHKGLFGRRQAYSEAMLVVPEACILMIKKDGQGGGGLMSRLFGNKRNDVRFIMHWLLRLHKFATAMQWTESMKTISDKLGIFKGLHRCEQYDKYRHPQMITDEMNQLNNKLVHAIAPLDMSNPKLVEFRKHVWNMFGEN